VLKIDRERTPGFKLALAIVVGLVLTIPLFSVWLLVYDRKTQSEEATASITAGWGGPQAIAGPVLVIPYRATATETVIENGQTARVDDLSSRFGPLVQQPWPEPVVVTSVPSA